MRTLFLLLTLLPFYSLATPGYYGKDAKIKSKMGNIFVVEQAGYSMKIDATKLPHDLRVRWSKSVGQTIESAIPYAAITQESKIKNFKAPPVIDR